MGMRFVETNKKRIAFKRLLTPITWFHKDAEVEDTFKFVPNPEAADCIFGYREDATRYEIFCPIDLRDILIKVLNLCHKIRL